MTVMHDILEALLSNSIAAAVLACVALLASRLRAPSALVHGLWILVLLKLVTPPLFHVEVEGFEAAPSVARAVEPSAWQPIDVAPIEVVQHWVDPATLVVAPGVDDDVVAPFDPWAFASTVWVIGGVAMLLGFAVRVFRFRRVLRGASPPDPALRGRIERLAARLGLRRIPEVVIVDARVSPLVWCCLGRPRLVLPRGLLGTLEPGVVDTLLAHELAHLRRGDHRVRHVELLVCALHWWNPLVWWAVQRLRAAEEECCDAWVVWALPRARRNYAEALVGTVEFLERNRTLPVAASGVGRIDDLKRRITMIMQGRTSRTLSRQARLALVAFAVLFLPLMPAVAQQEPGRTDVESQLEAERMRVAELRTHVRELETQLQDLERQREVGEVERRHLAELEVELTQQRDELAAAREWLARHQEPGRTRGGKHDVTVRVSREPQVVAQTLARAQELLASRGDMEAAQILGELAGAFANTERGPNPLGIYDRARAEHDASRRRAEAAELEAEAARNPYAKIPILADLFEQRRAEADRARNEYRRVLEDRAATEARTVDEQVSTMRQRLDDFDQRQNDRVRVLEAQVQELTELVRSIAERTSGTSTSRKSDRGQIR
ncbi:MAG: M48 family metalloprotease [Planctomycetes bacterium]|nr:M48 family metalloprotease [Planctomycetota bacterium]